MLPLACGGHAKHDTEQTQGKRGLTHYRFSRLYGYSQIDVFYTGRRGGQHVSVVGMLRSNKCRSKAPSPTGQPRR